MWRNILRVMTSGFPGLRDCCHISVHLSCCLFISRKTYCRVIGRYQLQNGWADVLYPSVCYTAIIYSVFEVHNTVVIIRPHRMHGIKCGCCYRCSVVCVCVCLSVCQTHWWADRDAIWGLDSGAPLWVPSPLQEKALLETPHLGMPPGPVIDMLDFIPMQPLATSTEQLVILHSSPLLLLHTRLTAFCTGEPVPER